MEMLLSGSSGLSEAQLSRLAIGSLVELKNKNSIGIIIKNLDLDLYDGPYRYLVYHDYGTMFGTYLDDMRMIQILSGGC